MRMKRGNGVDMQLLPGVNASSLTSVDAKYLACVNSDNQLHLLKKNQTVSRAMKCRSVFPLVCGNRIPS